ncbi:MAG: LptF/LptG family permease [Desulfomonile sp.]|nr:LptF/LptG family permease [Deltaproteobacteria bacterium]
MIGFSIINRYVFREISVSFAFCFAVFLVAGLIAGFLPLLQKGMEAGLELTLILFQVLINALPGTLVTVLPLSIMIGILLGLGRMATDNEISAIKSSGISILRLLPPVAFLGLIGLGASLICTLVLIPKGIAQGRRLMQEAISKRLDAGIEERTFFGSLKNLIVYVEKIDSSTGVMSRVFIRETTQPNETTTILAKKGVAYQDPEGKAFILNLRDGTILKEDLTGDSTGILAFETYVFRYPLDQAGLNDAPKALEEMSISAVRDRVKMVTTPKETDTSEVLAYYERVKLFAGILIIQRFTYPLACLALAIIAFPIGILNMGRSRLNNVSLGLIAVFVYYALVLATERAARSNVADPILVLPLPPLLFILGSAYLIRCASMERIPAVIIGVQEWIARLKTQHSKY